MDGLFFCFFFFFKKCCIKKGLLFQTAEMNTFFFCFIPTNFDLVVQWWNLDIRTFGALINLQFSTL